MFFVIDELLNESHLECLPNWQHRVDETPSRR